jgi:hypothetical protein
LSQVLLEESVDSLYPYCSPVMPEELNSDQGRLAISTELSAANSHFDGLAAAARIGGHQRVAELAEMSRIAPLSKIEMSPSVIPRHLAKGWCEKWPAFRCSAKRHALDAIVATGLLQAQAHAVGHAHSPVAALGTQSKVVRTRVGHSRVRVTGGGSESAN